MFQIIINTQLYASSTNEWAPRLLLLMNELADRPPTAHTRTAFSSLNKFPPANLKWQTNPKWCLAVRMYEYWIQSRMDALFFSFSRRLPAFGRTKDQATKSSDAGKHVDGVCCAAHFLFSDAKIPRSYGSRGGRPIYGDGSYGDCFLLFSRAHTCDVVREENITIYHGCRLPLRNEMKKAVINEKTYDILLNYYEKQFHTV